jgi:hypothetical protein
LSCARRLAALTTQPGAPDARGRRPVIASNAAAADASSRAARASSIFLAPSCQRRWFQPCSATSCPSSTMRRTRSGKPAATLRGGSSVPDSIVRQP